MKTMVPVKAESKADNQGGVAGSSTALRETEQTAFPYSDRAVQAMSRLIAKHSVGVLTQADVERAKKTKDSKPKSASEPGTTQSTPSV